MQRIYVVEDDDNIREMLVYALSAAGFLAEGFPEGMEFFAAMQNAMPSLIVLDIMLPGEDGMTILKKLRGSKKTSRTPVILLTAKGAELDRIKGLDSGADDYITKPFSVMEAISRIRAVLRRCDGGVEKPVELRIGCMMLHSDRRVVLVEGEEVILTYKEFELLHYLMLNEGIVLSRDKLIEQVWGFDYNGESRTVDMHIKSLRQKLGSCGGLIKTVRNVGYKMGG